MNTNKSKCRRIQNPPSKNLRKTASSLILGRSDLRGIGAYHLPGDKDCAAETVQMPFLAKLMVDWGYLEMKILKRVIYLHAER